MILSFSVSHTLFLCLSITYFRSLLVCVCLFPVLEKHLYVFITATYLKICVPFTTVWQTEVDVEWERGNLGVVGVGSGHLRECQGGRGAQMGRKGQKRQEKGIGRVGNPELSTNMCQLTDGRNRLTTGNSHPAVWEVSLVRAKCWLLVRQLE